MPWASAVSSVIAGSSSGAGKNGTGSVVAAAGSVVALAGFPTKRMPGVLPE
jgi:hypothetical protein